VPAQYQIRGLGYPELTVPDGGPTEEFITSVLGLEPGLIRVIESDEPRTRYGSGGVHHLALKVPDGQAMADWVTHLDEAGYHNSGIVDRHYFQSIYVRERNGILFELATEGPGFTVDGPLGVERLSLPPFLEPRRAQIEARVSPWPPE
jgi:glyoxalase family protein